MRAGHQRGEPKPAGKQELSLGESWGPGGSEVSVQTGADPHPMSSALGRPEGQTWQPQGSVQDSWGWPWLLLCEDQGDAEHGTEGHRPDEHIWHTRECWWKTLITADLLLQLRTSPP